MNRVYTSCEITRKEGYYSIFPTRKESGGFTGGGSFSKIRYVPQNYYVYTRADGKPLAVFKDKIEMLTWLQVEYGCEIIES